MLSLVGLVTQTAVERDWKSMSDMCTEMVKKSVTLVLRGKRKQVIAIITPAFQKGGDVSAGHASPSYWQTF